MHTETKWTPAQATNEIRAIAQSMQMTIAYKKHAKERIAERGVIMGDVLYVLKYGFVLLDPEPSTRPGYNRYAMESKCPNGGNRTMRVVVIPDKKACFLKVVSVMWADEHETRAGTLIGEEE